MGPIGAIGTILGVWVTGWQQHREAKYQFYRPLLTNEILPLIKPLKTISSDLAGLGLFDARIPKQFFAKEEYQQARTTISKGEEYSKQRLREDLGVFMGMIDKLESEGIAYALPTKSSFAYFELRKTAL